MQSEIKIEFFVQVLNTTLNRAFFKVLNTTLNQTLENANRLIIILNFRHFRLSHILVEQEDQNKKAITIIKDALIGYKIFCTGSLSTLSVNFLKRKWKLKLEMELKPETEMEIEMKIFSKS